MSCKQYNYSTFLSHLLMCWNNGHNVCKKNWKKRELFWHRDKFHIKSNSKKKKVCAWKVDYIYSNSTTGIGSFVQGWGSEPLHSQMRLMFENVWSRVWKSKKRSDNFGLNSEWIQGGCWVIKGRLMMMTYIFLDEPALPDKSLTCNKSYKCLMCPAYTDTNRENPGYSQVMCRSESIYMLTFFSSVSTLSRRCWANAFLLLTWIEAGFIFL